MPTLFLPILLLATTTLAAPQPAPRLDLYSDPLPEGALARLGSVRLRAGTVQGLSFSSDSKLLATGDFFGVPRLWDTATGRQIVHFDDRVGKGWPVALSPDGRILATNLTTHDDSWRTQFWDAQTGKHLRTAEISMDAPMALFTFSADGQTLYCGSGNDVYSIEVRTGRQTGILRAPAKDIVPRS